MRVSDHSAVMEVLLDFGDAEALPGYWTEDGPTPVRRYGLADLSPFEVRRGPIYRRHGLAPHVVEITDAGAALLNKDLKADGFASAAGLPPGEFLGLQLGRWLAPKSPQKGLVLFREMQFLRYRIERARTAKKRDVVSALHALYAEWKARHAPYDEAFVRDFFKKTVH